MHIISVFVVVYYREILIFRIVWQQLTKEFYVTVEKAQIKTMQIDETTAQCFSMICALTLNLQSSQYHWLLGDINLYLFSLILFVLSVETRGS